jgi:SAM-dependent methyltransferase
MQSIPDWLELWREIVARQRSVDPEPAGPWTPENDPWRERAQRFATRSRRKWEQSDPLRAGVADALSPDDTVLDIGAGTGDWAVFLAPRVRALTALEPSPAMRAVLAQRLADDGVGNVTVAAGYWPDFADVPPHDVVLCAHAMYGAADFAAFVDRMTRTARRACYLLLKVPAPDGVMAEAASRVWGQPHDSPDFVIAYNALLQLGIAADVRIDPTRWGIWRI